MSRGSVPRTYRGQVVGQGTVHRLVQRDVHFPLGGQQVVGLLCTGNRKVLVKATHWYPEAKTARNFYDMESRQVDVAALSSLAAFTVIRG